MSSFGLGSGVPSSRSLSTDSRALRGSSMGRLSPESIYRE